MSFIEGIGDEVTAFFVIVIVIVLATFVTFIGSGHHLYISPTHTRILPVQPELVSSQQNSSTQVTHTENTDNRIIAPPNPPGTGQWVPADSRFYEEILSGNRPTDDISDDTEEQSSSDDARPSEPYPDTPDGETPSAPPEDTATEEADETEPRDPNEIRIRLKYLDDTERTVKSTPTTKIRDFIRNHFPDELASNKIVRLIFCGHLLRDPNSLEAYRILDNSVVHVQILQADTTPRSAVTQNTDLDLSHLLWPLVSLVLGICWIFYFKYPEFFSMLSLGLLLLFTGSFVVFYSSHVHQ